MFITTAIVNLLLFVAFLGAGLQKATGKPDVVEGLGRIGVSPRLVRVIGSLELAGAIGVAAGLVIAWLGVAAAASLSCLMVGAMTYHVKAGDYRDPRWRGPALMPPALLVVSLVALALRVATM